MKKILAFFLLVLYLPVSSFADMQVSFLNVGQGDCTIIQCDGEAMVIDGGPAASSDYVYSYIRNTLGLTWINYVVSTHPHVDHVAGIAAVLNAAPVDVILTPTLEWDSKAFRKMIEYADLAGTPVVIPEEGESFPLGEATVTVLHCWPEVFDPAFIQEYGSRTNDSSIVLRIDYGRTSLIVTGDAEEWSEYMMIDSGLNLKADVLRIAHHGSQYSSSLQFLQAVQPQYAVISVGADNGYGHPHQATLNRLSDVGTQVLRTDELGTILMISDGEGFRIE